MTSPIRVAALMALSSIAAVAVPAAGVAQDAKGNWTEFHGDYRA